MSADDFATFSASREAELLDEIRILKTTIEVQKRFHSEAMHQQKCDLINPVLRKVEDITLYLEREIVTKSAIFEASGLAFEIIKFLKEQQNK